MKSNKQKTIYDYKCEKCNKNYASYQSLWNHNKIKHTPNSNQGTPNCNQGTPNSNQGTTKNNQQIVNYHCKYCNKSYKIQQSRWKHEQKCKTEKDKITKIELEKIKLELLKEENAKMRIQYKMSKNCKNIITTNSHNQTTNCTINNIFVKYNDISYDTLTNQERNEIFNSYNMIEESINKIHFNSNNPEQNNIYITNLKDPYCNIFDGKQFSAITKNDLLPDLIDLHLFELYLSKKKYKLKNNVIAKIDKLEEKLNKNHNKYVDENDKIYKNYKDYMIEIVKILIYNSCDKNKLDAIKKIDNFVRKELETFI